MNRFFFQIDENRIESFKAELLVISHSQLETKAISALDFLHRVSEGVVSVMDFQNIGSTSLTLDFLNFCVNKRTSNLSLISLNLSHVLGPAEHNEMLSNLTVKILYPDARYVLNEMWQDVGIDSDCENFFDTFKSVSMRYTRSSPIYITAMSMDDFIEETFPYVRYNYSSNTQYQECVALETEVLPQIEGYIVEFRNVEEILINLTTSGIQESLVLAETLSSYYDEIINIGLIYHKYKKKIKKACLWTKSVFSHQNSLLWKFISIHGTLTDTLQDVDKTLEKIRNAYMKLIILLLSIQILRFLKFTSLEI